MTPGLIVVTNSFLTGTKNDKYGSQVTLNTAFNDFNSGQFKTRLKKMADQANAYLYLNAFLTPELFGAGKLAHICPIKALLT